MNTIKTKKLIEKRGKDLDRQFWKGNLSGQYGDLGRSNNLGRKN